MHRSFPLFAALCAVLLLASPALAHKVNLYAYVEDGVIQGEGYFTGGGKPQDCPVTVTDATGRVLGETRTDTGGKFSLKLPPLTPESAPLKLVLTAGDGHRNDFPLTARDLGLAAPAAGGTPASPAAPGPGSQPAAPAGAPEAGSSAPPASGAAPVQAVQAAPGVPGGAPAASPPSASPAAPAVPAPAAPADKAALEEAVARVLDRKLAPVNAQLAALAERADQVGSREILGGLGWIAGLFGVAFYFKGKKRG